MTGTVIPFARGAAPSIAVERYIEGKARCMNCGHEWAATRPAGNYVDGMECSQCHTLRGVWVNPFCLANGTDRYVCCCGNDLFMLTRTGTFCIKCGERKDFR